MEGWLLPLALDYRASAGPSPRAIHYLFLVGRLPPLAMGYRASAELVSLVHVEDTTVWASAGPSPHTIDYPFFSERACWSVVN